MYEVGFAAMTVALIELLLLPTIRRVSIKKNDLQKIMDESRRFDVELMQKASELEKSIESIKLDNVFTTIHAIQHEQRLIQRELSFIRRKVDPEYDRAEKIVEAQINSSA